MSDVKVREDGWYLGKWGEHSNLEVCYIYNNKVSKMGGYFEPHSYYWISEYPLNLEQLAINDGYNAAILKKVQDEFDVKIGEERDCVNQD